MSRGRRASDAFGDNGFGGWGGYMEAKKSKLLDQFNEKAALEVEQESKLQQLTTKIFQGVSIFVNGYTVPTADELKRIMMLHGGQYHNYYSTSKTKFIIATNLADAKIKQLKGQPKIVKPTWITECLSAGKLLDHRPFLLYSNQSKTQPKISFPTTESFTRELEPSTSKSVKLEINNMKKEENSELQSNDKKLIIPESDESTDSDEPIIEPHLAAKIQNEPINKPSHSGVQTSSPNPEIPESENILVSSPILQNPLALPETSTIASTVPSNKATKCTEIKPAQRLARAGEPNFLSEFYNNSRLHHISTMGSMFKKYISDLRKNHDGKFTGLDELKEWSSLQNNNPWEVDGTDRIIMHIDMDCFFVSVGLRKRPELRGLPVAVTHARGNTQPPRQGSSRAAEIECYRNRMEKKLNKNNQSNEVSAPLKEWMTVAADESSSMSEIASCSYEARKAGLRNGMFLGAALKKCPNLKTIPYDFDGYKEVSFCLYNTVASFTLNIEAVSCDEMFVNCTDILKMSRISPLQFATFLRTKIKDITGCPASTGFGGNILLARLATRKAKPDGQFYLLPENVTNFMQEINIDDLPGVGRTLSLRLQSQGISTCGELQKLSLSQLQTEFGQKTGQALYSHCRGLDDRELELEHQRKSVSAEVNYGIRFQKQDEVDSFIKELAQEVQNRLHEVNSKGRCITLKLMVKAKNAPTETAKFLGHGVCDSLSRSTTLTTETSDANIIAREAISLIKQLAVIPSTLRGMGIQVTKLTQKSSAEGSLHQFLTKNSNNRNINNSKQPQAGTSKNIEQPKQSNIENSELDPDFLAALPEDIRAEVMEEHTRTMKIVANISNSTNDDSPKLKESISSLSFSQIDPSFLDALPEDVKADLITDFERNKPPVTNKKTTGLQSPRKNIKVSPKKGKSSPLKTRQVLSKGQKKIDVILKSPLKDVTATNMIPENPASPPASDESEDESFGVLSVKMPIEELLPLIREWIDTQDLPQGVDGDLISQFLQQLIVTHRIDKVGAVLRTMHRKIEDKNSDAWKDIYHEAVNKVQKTMIKEYGAELCVITDFD